MNVPILLATESRYKIALFKRLQVSFTAQAANIDETAQTNESARHLAERLAHQKVAHFAAQFHDHVVIGTDQSAAVDGEILRKPGSLEDAIEQLKSLSGQRITFFTCGAFSAPGFGIHAHCDSVHAQLRPLTEAEIVRYVHADQPTDTVGSFKVEQLGISLFQSIESRDPTALEGLGLIQIAHWLREVGYAVP